MRPQHEREEAERWIAFGLNDCAIARLTGIPRTTIRDWRKRPADAAAPRNACPRCSDSPLPEETYSYLLGLYLGDGCLSEHARGVFRLRVALDKRYPGIIDECRRAVDVVRATGAPAHVQQSAGCVNVGAYWRHWPCLFPQHGGGPKHLRRIELAPWQQRIVERYPAALLRGLIHSDGWRGTNNVRARGKRYGYPRYQFVNFSADIRAIFCRACDDYGVAWRQMRWNTISIARRDDVAKLDLVVGLKS